MSLQGRVAANHVPVNNFELVVQALDQSIFFVEISGIELETQAVDLPDRTTASGGNFLPQEWTAKTMLHHSAERAALEAWLAEGQDPVDPAYKKTATLIHKTIAGTTNGKYLLTGMWVMKEKLPDLDRANDGEPGMIEWTFKTDRIAPML